MQEIVQYLLELKLSFVVSKSIAASAFQNQLTNNDSVGIGFWGALSMRIEDV